MGKVVKFFHLSGPEKFIFCRAVYLLLYYRLALPRKHFQTLIDRLSNSGSGEDMQASPLIPAETLIGLLAAACRVVPFSTCLSRSMAGQRLLMQYGYFPRLHIGVARENSRKLEAHAWLSLNGKVVLGNVPDLERYRELPLDQDEGAGEA